MSEREQIVAWLRRKEREAFIPLPDTIIPAHRARDDYGNDLGWTIPERRRKMSRLPNANDYADAIERGDHLPQPPSIEE